MTEEPKTPPNQPVGTILRRRRLALKLSLAEIELATKIRGKYLVSIESGAYKGLPNDIYSRGFVRHYASYLGLDGELLAALYVAERGGLAESSSSKPRLDRPKKLVVTGQVATVLGVTLALLAIVGYLVFQFSALAAPPQLVVTSPPASQIVSGAVVDVVGHATGGADVSINNSPVTTDSVGNFSERVALQDGLNVLQIVAKTRLGKSTTVTRNVLAKVPPLDAAAAVVPTAPFDGVAVVVAVKNEATAVVVSVDGQEVWRGTVIAGWSQLFKASSEIKISTGNAGITYVTVTNKTVAGKALGALGKPGEIRQDQVFSKDTVFQ